MYLEYIYEFYFLSPFLYQNTNSRKVGELVSFVPQMRTTGYDT